MSLTNEQKKSLDKCRKRYHDALDVMEENPGTFESCITFIKMLQSLNETMMRLFKDIFKRFDRNPSAQDIATLQQAYIYIDNKALSDHRKKAFVKEPSVTQMNAKFERKANGLGMYKNISINWTFSITFADNKQINWHHMDDDTLDDVKERFTEKMQDLQEVYGNHKKRKH